MKFKNFMGVSNTPAQMYYKEGVELLYPDQDHPLRIAVLPAYDPEDPTNPTGWIPAVAGEDESDFYTTVRAAKFVGHGNRRAKVSFLSPRTFDLSADDPYEAFYEYCSQSDKWSYLTKDGRGRRLTGEVEGAIFPRMKNFFVANVLDASAGSRGGVFVTELSEAVAKSILYSVRKNGSRIPGLAFARTPDGELAYGDITDPRGALVMEVVWTGKGYAARPQTLHDGTFAKMAIPDVILQHRWHMEDPESFLVRPVDGQEIVDRLASMLRGYKSPGGDDELNALKEAVRAKYGEGAYTVDESVRSYVNFERAARTSLDSSDEEKAEAVDEAVERAAESERYIPVEKPQEEDPPAGNQPQEAEAPPGEDIDPSDIAALRAMLKGGLS